MSAVATSGAGRVVVIFVHGLWMTGVDMVLLRWRVRRCGFDVQQFTYTSIRSSVKDNAVRLQQYISQLDVDRVHLVGHSLGGLVIRQFLHDASGLKSARHVGRIVTLGTPHNGSVVAGKMAMTPLRYLLGRSVRGGLDGCLPVWAGAHELGVIAGSLNIGLGWLVPALSGVASDGTVMINETRLEGMTDHVTVPVSHSAMLFSAIVARQVCAFLHQGRFDH